MLISDECSNAVEIQKNLKTNKRINVNASTVRCMLCRNGFSLKIKRKKPYLKKKHHGLRLKFTKKYKNWGFDEWKRVIWLDESKFMIFGFDGCKYC